MKIFFTKIVVSALVVSMGLVACSSTPESTVNCGTVSLYLQANTLASSTANNLYPMVITHLDGSSVISKPSYRLTSGIHTFKGMELIDDVNLDAPIAKRTPKSITIDVKPNTQYFLAAEFLPANNNSQNFWQPIVWKTRANECKSIETTKIE